MADYFVDPSIGTDTGAGTVGDPWGHTGNEIQKALDNITAANDTVHVKAGTAVDFAGTNLDFSTYGATGLGSQLTISGYTSAAWDGGMAELDFNGASSGIADTVDGVNFMFLNIGGSTNSYQISCDNNCSAYYCKFDGTAGTNGWTSDTSPNIIGCEFVNCGIAFLGALGGTFAWNVVHHSDAGDAVRSAGVTNNNLILCSNTASQGITTQLDGGTVFNNTVINSTAGTKWGIKSNTSSQSMHVFNNYVEGFSGVGGLGFTFAGSNYTNVARANRWFNCTTGENSATTTVAYGTDNSVTTASGMTNIGSADYTPTSELIGAGWATGFKNLSGNAMEVDIGAIQSVPTGGGGGGIIRRVPITIGAGR